MSDAETETESPKDPLAVAKDAIVLAMLGHAPFDGWSRKALAAAATESGFDESMAERAFPGGPVEAAAHFATLADRKLAEEAAAEDLTKLRFTERVAWLVRRRLEAWIHHREAVRHAVATLALPGHAAEAARAGWHTVDTIWHAAGDTSTDFSYYTRRATLLAVYGATLLVWLDDRTEGCAATWAFLDRRLADVGRFTKFRQKTEARLKKIPNPLRAVRQARGAFRRPL